MFRILITVLLIPRNNKDLDNDMSNLTKKELRLIIEDYKLKFNNKNINLGYRGVNDRGELSFSVYELGKFVKYYTLAKLDLSVYNEHPYLTIPGKISGNLLVNDKRYIVNWINKKINIKLLEEDISILILRGNKVTVVISPTSGRFFNNFNIIIN